MRPKEEKKTKKVLEIFLYYFELKRMMIVTLSLGDVNFLDCVEAVQKDSLPSPIKSNLTPNKARNPKVFGQKIMSH
ncbi:hypothetical protein [Leptospira jelokensis]|uniref:Uncharacterized protein n=1 Tax=Leptospira jelokensis TaxID=2484931 RepID=A0A4Z1A906_9LEPT|nr:hypothetical protein [Leptospira jelokensis]TGL77243.1 hypothetical protein EHQ62_00210 [Leptospira jelokensis]